MLVQKYHDSHCQDKEVIISIQKAVESSPELRSKKSLIDSFIAGINDIEDVLEEWRRFVAEQKEKELMEIIQSENLKEEETRAFISDSFKNGFVKTTGTDIVKILPPVGRFGKNSNQNKKQSVLAKILKFFEKFFGISNFSEGE